LKEFAERFPATAELAITSMILLLYLGLLQVLFQQPIILYFDYATMSLSVAGLSIPVFGLV